MRKLFNFLMLVFLCAVSFSVQAQIYGGPVFNSASTPFPATKSSMLYFDREKVSEENAIEKLADSLESDEKACLIELFKKNTKPLEKQAQATYFGKCGDKFIHLTLFTFGLRTKDAAKNLPYLPFNLELIKSAHAGWWAKLAGALVSVFGTYAPDAAIDEVIKFEKIAPGTPASPTGPGGASYEGNFWNSGDPDCRPTSGIFC